MKKSSVYLIVFMLASLGDIIFPYGDNSIPHYVTKPFILISLIVYYLSKTDKISGIFVAALIACLAGDTLLLFEAESDLFFMAGLGSFLIAHLLLIVSYRKERWKKIPDGVSNVQKSRLAFPVVLAGSGLVVFLFPMLGKLTVPVMLYSLILVTMVLSAVSRLHRTTPGSFWCVYGGGVLFMLSDAVLAINKFSAPVPFSNQIIMLTYCAAQFLITAGIIEHQYSKDRTPASALR